MMELAGCVVVASCLVGWTLKCEHRRRAKWQREREREREEVEEWTRFKPESTQIVVLW